MLAANASLYRPDGLRLIHRALRQQGTLAVWSAGPSPRFGHNLRAAGFQWRRHNVPARVRQTIRCTRSTWPGPRHEHRHAGPPGRPRRAVS